MDLDSAVFYTEDIDRITRFYVDVVGFDLEYRDGDKYVSFIFPNGARLGINKSEFDREFPGVQTVFLAVENIEIYKEKFEELSFEFFEPYEEYDWGKYFAVLDPDGNKIGFIER